MSLPLHGTSVSDFSSEPSSSQVYHHNRRRSDVPPPIPPPRRRASSVSKPLGHSRTQSSAYSEGSQTAIGTSVRNSAEYLPDPYGEKTQQPYVSVSDLDFGGNPHIPSHHEQLQQKVEARRSSRLIIDEEQPAPQQPEQQQNKPEDSQHSPIIITKPKLPFRPRLAHFTWAWYTLVMSTGGLSLLIAAQPHQFSGLRQIGLVVYIINIILFVGVTSALITRFFLFAGTFKASLTHPREGFFFPTFFLSIATLITSTQRYAVPEPVDNGAPPQGPAGLLWVIQAAFWAYVVLTTIVAVGQYSFLFANSHRFLLDNMMPTWILPIFPIMLSGTIASVIAKTQEPSQAIPIITAGLTCQGLGVAVAGMMYAHMVGRLMQAGLPDREHRPGLFMCVGPPAFTALALIGLAQSLPANFDADLDGMLDAGMIQNMAIISAGFLWALSFWWFGIAVVAIIQAPPKYFHLGWWASVFPNTGFILATISLGKAFQNEPVLWFATVMSIFLLLMYGFVLFHHIRAVVVQDIMYPGKDEDVEDH
ncbi:voltage-dependent anion channel-domain-containing protein [Apodospora peruviana]|uniref:Voltage-dependent anion channel-domain-containing protein n=1 Tax=Apodospora peruviana TaxID=516989 RepID=A0AAE0IDP7_9PEZI|nr:voltage-dependent anion channel-domain-containing protein [Apodospora peruviana]